MKTIKIVALPFVFLVAVVMLEGCGGPEPGDEAEVMVMTKLLSGTGEQMQGVPTTQDDTSLVITWNNTMYTTDANPHGGRLQFAKDGDVVQVCDIDADGWQVRGAWGPNVNGDVCWIQITGGNGTCFSVGAGSGCNLPENRSIAFAICMRQGDRSRGCSSATWSSG
jgi:hypothetical protein